MCLKDIHAHLNIKPISLPYNDCCHRTSRKIFYSTVASRVVHPRGVGVLPYMGYIGMCGHKGYGFSALLVINRVSIIAILPPLWS